MRLQSQQMLDQIHDEPLQVSDTGPVDGDNDSSGSEEDPKRTMRKQRTQLRARSVRCRDLNSSDTAPNGMNDCLIE